MFMQVNLFCSAAESAQNIAAYISYFLRKNEAGQVHQFGSFFSIEGGCFGFVLNKGFITPENGM